MKKFFILAIILGMAILFSCQDQVLVNKFPETEKKIKKIPPADGIYIITPTWRGDAQTAIYGGRDAFHIAYDSVKQNWLISSNYSLITEEKLSLHQDSLNICGFYNYNYYCSQSQDTFECRTFVYTGIDLSDFDNRDGIKSMQGIYYTFSANDLLCLSKKGHAVIYNSYERDFKIYPYKIDSSQVNKGRININLIGHNKIFYMDYQETYYQQSFLLEGGYFIFMADSSGFIEKWFYAPQDHNHFSSMRR